MAGGLCFSRSFLFSYNNSYSISLQACHAAKSTVISAQDGKTFHYDILLLSYIPDNFSFGNSYLINVRIPLFRTSY